MKWTSDKYQSTQCGSPIVDDMAGLMLLYLTVCMFVYNQNTQSITDIKFKIKTFPDDSSISVTTQPYHFSVQQEKGNKSPPSFTLLLDFHSYKRLTDVNIANTCLQFLKIPD